MVGGMVGGICMSVGVATGSAGLQAGKAKLNAAVPPNLKKSRLDNRLCVAIGIPLFVC